MLKGILYYLNPLTAIFTDFNVVLNCYNLLNICYDPIKLYIKLPGIRLSSSMKTTKPLNANVKPNQKDKSRRMVQTLYALRNESDEGLSNI